MVSLPGTAGLDIKERDVIKLLHDDGWYLVVTRGSHRHSKLSVKPGRVTVAGKPGKDIAPGTLKSIFEAGRT